MPGRLLVVLADELGASSSPVQALIPKALIPSRRRSGCQFLEPVDVVESVTS